MITEDDIISNLMNIEVIIIPWSDISVDEDILIKSAKSSSSALNLFFEVIVDDKKDFSSDIFILLIFVGDILI